MTAARAPAAVVLPRLQSARGKPEEVGSRTFEHKIDYEEVRPDRQRDHGKREAQQFPDDRSGGWIVSTE
jgi:hypothetical protein